MPWCDPCERYLNPNSVSVVGTCPMCGERVTDADGELATSQKVPWHFWVFAGAAVVYLGGRRVQGSWMLVT